MKKFGFRTSSITFKALCIILPIQFLFLILGYNYVQDLIFKSESEKEKKFKADKKDLEDILKENSVLRFAKFNEFSPQKKYPNSIPVSVGKIKKISKGTIECKAEEKSGYALPTTVKDKLHFSVSIIRDLLFFSGNFEGYDIKEEDYMKIDLLYKNKNSTPLKVIFIKTDSNDDKSETEGAFLLRQKNEWMIQDSESSWKKNGGGDDYAYGTFILALKGKNIIQGLHKIRFSLHHQDQPLTALCKISTKKNISFFLTGVLKEIMNRIKETPNGIIFRDTNKKIIFKKNEDYPYAQNKQKKQSYLVSFGELLVGSQNTLSPMCTDIKQILPKQTLSKPTYCSSLFGKTVYIWQQRVLEESFNGFYKIAAIGTIVIGVTTILFLFLLLYIGFRYNSLQKEINKYISSDGEIFPSVEKMKSDKNDEIGVLAKILKLSFLKIRKRNTFYVKMSDFLRHELGQHFTKLHLKIANFSSKSNKEDTQQSLIKTLELSEKTLHDFTNASNVISALNAGQRKKIDLCAFMEEFIKYFQTSDSNIRFERKSKTVFAECIPDALERVFSAILENASDFRKKGTEIVCFIETQNSKTEIIIRNQGHLIEQKDLINIFELGFSQRENDNEAEGIHQGFGLFLVKSIIDFHGWSISARNNMETPGVEFVIQVQ